MNKSFDQPDSMFHGHVSHAVVPLQATSTAVMSIRISSISAAVHIRSLLEDTGRVIIIILCPSIKHGREGKLDFVLTASMGDGTQQFVHVMYCKVLPG